MNPNLLHVVTCISNPIGWKSRIDLAEKSIKNWLEAGVNVTLVECTYGERPTELAHLQDIGVSYIHVRAHTFAWTKENLLNIGIARLPASAQYIATIDADIVFRRPGWAVETLKALQVYPVIQPWSVAYDLGPNDEHIQMHRSFCSVHHAGAPVVPDGPAFWKFNNGPYDYPHSGYAWAYTRRALDAVGGLLDVAGMGSGDHHMALGLAGFADRSMPSGTNENYKKAVLLWESRALTHVNKKIGFVHGTIEHFFHGKKVNRAYVSRWDMFLEHNFDPYTDLKRNTYGVYEFGGNKPALEREFDNYLRSRDEDVNSLI